MTLFKQLWLGLILLLSASFYVSVSLASSHFEPLSSESTFENSQHLTLSLLAIWLSLISLGSLLLYKLLQPLYRIVQQAEHISQRRFTTHKLPYTHEFKQLVRSMNLLSTNIEHMLDEENQRLQQLIYQLQRDPDSGLLNRATFLDQLKSFIQHHNDESHGLFVIIRLMSLGKINQMIGRSATDRLIHDLALQLSAMIQLHPNITLGRLNNTDMALIIPGSNQFSALDEIIQQIEMELSQAFDIDVSLSVGITDYCYNEPMSLLFNRVDNALVISELAVHNKITMIQAKDYEYHDMGLTEWRHHIDSALKHNNLVLKRYPLVNIHQQVIHYECHSALMILDKERPAQQIMPWIHRLDWQSRFDCNLLESLIVSLYQAPAPTSIHLCADSISSLSFRHRMLTIFSQTPNDLLKLISIDVPESAAFNQLLDFKSFCQDLKSYPCKIGIKHFGVKLNSLSLIHDLGISYLKLDHSLLVKLDQLSEYHSFVQGICITAHTIGIPVYAPNIDEVNKIDALALIGIGGFTGSGVCVQESLTNS